jgi:NADPH-dependent 2,4-dienoyl-CoA reductase/sulfur reductase-like enzyme
LIYAIGDCTAKLMLAHTAEAQGVVAAETIAGAQTNPRSESDGLQNAVGFNDLGLPTLRRRDGDVTIVEFLDRMVPNEDKEVSAELAKAYKKLGIKVLTSTKVTGDDDGSRDGVGKDLFLVSDDPTGELGAWQSLDDRTDCDDRVVESDLVGHPSLDPSSSPVLEPSVLSSPMCWLITAVT